MHGVIFTELRKFVEGAHGSEVWEQAHDKAGLPRTRYLPIAKYDNDALPALVRALSDVTGATVTALLDEFGSAMAPNLLAYPGIHLQAHWRTVSVLEHIEPIIHKTVRRADPKASPPYLRVKRHSFDRIDVHYDSPLKLCAMAKGIIRGMARHFGEELVLHEETCMILGDPECKISVRLRPSALRAAVKP